MTGTPTVEIYHARMCSLCHEAMHWFDEQGIPHSDYELEWTGDRFADTEAYRGLTQRIGEVEFVPQIFINGRHIGGWKSLSELIKTGEVQAILGRS